MSTNSEVITEAFRMIGVLAEGIPLASEQATDGLRVMNDMLSDWDANSIDVGYIPQTSVSADSPIYSDALRAVKFNLAIELANSYGVEPPPVIFSIAQQSYARLLRDSVSSKLEEADMSHLPNSLSDWSIENG